MKYLVLIALLNTLVNYKESLDNHIDDKHKENNASNHEFDGPQPLTNKDVILKVS